MLLSFYSDSGPPGIRAYGFNRQNAVKNGPFFARAPVYKGYLASAGRRERPRENLSLTHAKTPRFSDRTAARAAGAGHPEEPELLEAVARHTLRLAASLLHTPAAGSQENTFCRRAPSFLRSLSPAQSRTAAPLARLVAPQPATGAPHSAGSAYGALMMLTGSPSGRASRRAECCMLAAWRRARRRRRAPRRPAAPQDWTFFPSGAVQENLLYISELISSFGVAKVNFVQY